MNGKQYKKRKVKCLFCGKETKIGNIYQHTIKKHKKTAVLGDTFQFIKKGEQVSKKEASHPHVAQASYIDVPLTIRIPLVMGEPQIIFNKQGE